MELIQSFLDWGDWEVGVAATVQAGLAEEPLGRDPEVAGGMGTQIGHRVREAAGAGGEGPGF